MHAQTLVLGGLRCQVEADQECRHKYQDVVHDLYNPGHFAHRDHDDHHTSEVEGYVEAVQQQEELLEDVKLLLRLGWL